MSNLRGNKVRNAAFAIVGLIAMLVSSLILLALIAALAIDGSSRFSSHFFSRSPPAFPSRPVFFQRGWARRWSWW
jgi:hypothetical protein